MEDSNERRRWRAGRLSYITDGGCRLFGTKTQFWILNGLVACQAGVLGDFCSKRWSVEKPS
jgi:hypothetical protein